jgi:hypothetical protein
MIFLKSDCCRFPDFGKNTDKYPRRVENIIMASRSEPVYILSGPDALLLYVPLNAM